MTVESFVTTGQKMYRANAKKASQNNLDVELVCLSCELFSAPELVVFILLSLLFCTDCSSISGRL